jgi:phosphoribosylglycinamide formyltransferase-1
VEGTPHKTYGVILFNIAVLSSGMSRGTNLRAMAKYFKDNNLPVRISFVIRTKCEASITEVCAELNITCHLLSYKNPEQFEEKVLFLCQYHGVHLIALSGFLKKLSPVFIREARVPILNIHPALLPKYGGEGMYGMAVHKVVHESGDKESGATVHLVDTKYDHGKIIAQEKVDISGCNSAEEISVTVIKAEHRLYGKAIWDYLVKLFS